MVVHVSVVLRCETVHPNAKQAVHSRENKHGRRTKRARLRRPPWNVDVCIHNVRVATIPRYAKERSLLATLPPILQSKSWDCAMSKRMRDACNEENLTPFLRCDKLGVSSVGACLQQYVRVWRYLSFRFNVYLFTSCKREGVFTLRVRGCIDACNARVSGAPCTFYPCWYVHSLHAPRGCQTSLSRWFWVRKIDRDY